MSQVVIFRHLKKGFSMAVEKHTSNLAVEGLNALTFTRFFAALLVVAFHFSAGVPPFDNKIIEAFVSRGQLAVAYFFLLSGFIMTRVYANESGMVNKGKFWLARFARIYPVYLLSLVVMYSLGNFEGTTVALNVFMLQAWSEKHALTMNVPGWSLSVEVFFYACFPWVLPWLTRRRVVVIAVVAAIAMLLHDRIIPLPWHTLEKLPLPWPDLTGPYSPIRNLPFFLIGAVLGACTKWKMIPRMPGRLASIVAVASIVLPVVWIHNAIPLVVIPFSILILSLAQGDGVVQKAMSHKVPVFLGEASYALYILHYPLMIWYYNAVVLPFELSRTAMFYSYLVILIALSCLVFRFMETPARRLIRSYKSDAARSSAQSATT